jgi:hypothetical protein
MNIDLSKPQGQSVSSTANKDEKKSQGADGRIEDISKNTHSSQSPKVSHSLHFNTTQAGRMLSVSSTVLASEGNTSVPTTAGASIPVITSTAMTPSPDTLTGIATIGRSCVCINPGELQHLAQQPHPVKRIYRCLLHSNTRQNPFQMNVEIS